MTFNRQNELEYYSMKQFSSQGTDNLMHWSLIVPQALSFTMSNFWLDVECASAVLRLSKELREYSTAHAIIEIPAQTFGINRTAL